MCPSPKMVRLGPVSGRLAVWAHHTHYLLRPGETSLIVISLEGAYSCCTTRKSKVNPVQSPVSMTGCYEFFKL